MQQQVIINVGVSGSGKTTWSTEYIKNNPKTLRINRDDIRKTLVGSLSGYYQRSDLNKIEQEVNFIEIMMLFSILKEGYDVIVDNTNLKSLYIKRITEYVKNIPPPLEVDIKFKIFSLDNAETLKYRVKERDGLFEADYIDKQLLQLKSAVSYVKDNYPNQILE